MLAVCYLRKTHYLQALAIHGLVCFFFSSPCACTLNTPPPITVIFSAKIPVTLSVRVSRPGSYPNATFFGALLGTESHKAFGDTGVGDGRTAGSRKCERRLNQVQQQWSSCSVRERRVYLPGLALLFINCLHIEALEAVLSPSVLARG